MIMICKSSAVKAVAEWGIDAQADVLGPADLRIYSLAHVLGPLGVDMTIAIEDSAFLQARAG
jgi:hypothetical protein